MLKQVTLVTNPPKLDPANKEKSEKTRQILSSMDLNKASMIVFLQS